MHVNDLQKSVLTEKIRDFYQDDLQGAPSPSGDWHSNPIPTISAKRPHWSSSTNCSQRAPKCGHSTPKPWATSKPCTATASISAKAPTRLPKGADCLAIMTEWSEFRTPGRNTLQYDPVNGDFSRRNMCARSQSLYPSIKSCWRYKVIVWACPHTDAIHLWGRVPQSLLRHFLRPPHATGRRGLTAFCPIPAESC
jgi:hypothetical protein